MLRLWRYSLTVSIFLSHGFSASNVTVGLCGLGLTTQMSSQQEALTKTSVTFDLLSLQTPFTLTLRLWDVFMLEGERLLTAMSYTILKVHKSKSQTLKHKVPMLQPTPLNCVTYKGVKVICYASHQPKD